MKQYIILLLMMFGVFAAKTQNYVQYNHYIANQGLLNPAYNGTRDVISGIMVHRNQFLLAKGAPMNEAVNIHGPVEGTDLGVGVWIANDNVGLTNTFDFFGAASYKFAVDRKQFVSLGLQLGVSSFIINGDDAVVADYGDEIFTGKTSKVNFNVGFGAYYFGDNYFGGFSIPKFFSNELKKDDLDGGEYRNVFSGKNIHSYLYGGYVFEWGDVKVKPTLLARFIYGAPVMFDITSNVLVMEKLWLGLSYRTPSDLVFLTEYIIDRRFTVRYSFDYGLSDVNQISKYGSHEISLQFDFTFGKRPGMRSIRYF
ncbi:MAG: PorP/SprF family type IX secretion system membrane protein [Marinilabiliaceae bacterium]|nr:PorP/SprF family type IX secretion system membrane protein [Marinilabiliaceae bacterium]